MCRAMSFSTLLLAPLLASAAPWPVAGQQGIVKLVIVPADEARSREAYARQIEALCEPERTCFLNFYTNTTGAPLSLPLADAIGNEATAIFRRSNKRGAERFQWSCRVAATREDCF
jgi:hypothetical protein